MFQKDFSIINLSQQLMRVQLLILAIAAKLLAFTIKQPETTMLFTSRKALQFDNFTGIGVRQEHITAFTNFANSASAFYKEDVEANARYIKEQMDILFGVPGRNFLVMIQTDQARSGWLIWVSSENIIASLTGINRINTNWSYIFLKFLVPSTLDDYHLITQDTKGQGITAETEELINNAVNKRERGDSCTCNDDEISDIGYSLINGQGIAWNTICGSTENISAYIFSTRGLWIHTKPKKCYYIFFVSQ